MTLMSRKVDYALLILCHLHRQPEGACARKIATRFRLSRAFVANILKDLCHRGWLRSERGIKGGYLLQRSMEQTSLCELMEALDNPVSFAACNQPAGAGGCPLAGLCPVQGPIAEVHRRICEVLRSVPLVELFPPGGETPEHEDAPPGRRRSLVVR
jgi:Rrf2 family transcriptional regulator, cysteine metabolism repressor